MALDHLALREEGYRSIGQLLTERGYTSSGTQPFIFYREVPVAGRMISVEVDLLASEHGGTTEGHRTQTVQDVRARKALGCNLVFGHSEQVRVSASLPGGSEESVVAHVAGMVPFLTIKGLAVKERRRDKDPYDIYYCLRNLPGTVAELAEAFRPWLTIDLVQEALTNIEEHFATPDSPGPGRVADFEGLEDREDRELLQRDVSEQVMGFLSAVRALGAAEGGYGAATTAPE